ncbi:MAG: sulfite exporter TauE/SafE family protein [Pseudomonadota bacterium]
MDGLLLPLDLADWGLLFAGAVLAGVVRGFAGFGTGMIFLPFAGRVLDPFVALTVLMVMDLFGPLPLLPRALRDGQMTDVRRLVTGLVIALPIGLWVLTYFPPEVFRTGVSLIALVMLVALVGGWRYRGRVSPGGIYATGAAGGFLGGVSGLPGPPVILFYMASPHGPAVIRANTLLYLIIADLVTLIALWVGGLLVFGALLTGLAVMLPYMSANLLGAAIFQPEAEGRYRAAAYLIIAASALGGLPIWD